MIKYILILLFFLNALQAECTISKERLPQYNRTLDTIGDSLTWLGYGEKLRCLLDKNGIEFDFVGYFIDIYGYRHDGHGGDKTDNIIDRISTIPKSDVYLLWIGINDTKKTGNYTYSNILKIANLLYKKNIDAIIYISTLLPTINYNNAHNNDVNDLLRSSLSCTNCLLIDLNKYFLSLPHWKSLLIDGIHPNERGYQYITDYLVKMIK